MAFQLKAPKGTKDGTAYKYTLVRYQHDLLFGLAQLSPQSVFYVLPHYVTKTKLQADLPDLLQDTWLLSIDQMPTQPVFGGAATKVVRCEAGQAKINPEYKLLSVGLLTEGPFSGIPAHDFARWYERHVHRDREMRRNPWLVRGLRVSIVAPQ